MCGGRRALTQAKKSKGRGLATGSFLSASSKPGGEKKNGPGTHRLWTRPNCAGSSACSIFFISYYCCYLQSGISLSPCVWSCGRICHKTKGQESHETLVDIVDDMSVKINWAGKKQRRGGVHKWPESASSRLLVYLVVFKEKENLPCHHVHFAAQQMRDGCRPSGWSKGAMMMSKYSLD